MKVEVPDFVGRLDLDAFYNWITALEDYFDWFTVPDDRKVRFIKLKLKRPACAWWSTPIREWDEMKEHLESKYLLLNYDQSVKITVDQYIERFHELTIRSKLAEIDAQVLARYLKGLKPDIRREMLSVHVTPPDPTRLDRPRERYTPSGNSRHYYNTDLGNFHFLAPTSSKPFVDTPKRATTSDSRSKGKAFGE
ncbi:hypothetical protein ACOSQ2_027731 [Xanthoceras sorbifolium]